MIRRIINYQYGFLYKRSQTQKSGMGEYLFRGDQKQHSSGSSQTPSFNSPYKRATFNNRHARGLYIKDFVKNLSTSRDLPLLSVIASTQAYCWNRVVDVCVTLELFKTSKLELSTRVPSPKLQAHPCD